MGCHLERQTSIINLPVADISELDLPAIEAAARDNDILQFILTVPFAKELEASQFEGLKNLLSDNAFRRLTIIPSSNTLLVAHLGACRM